MSYNLLTKGLNMKSVIIKNEFQIDGLNEKQARVAALCTLGYSNKEIASALFCSEQRVASVLTECYKALNLKTRAQLIVYGLPFSDWSA